MATYSSTMTRLLAEGPRCKGNGWHRLGNALKTTVLLAGLTALVLLLGQKLGGPRGLALRGRLRGGDELRLVLVQRQDRPGHARGAAAGSTSRRPWLHEMVERAGRAGGHAQAEGLPAAHAGAQRVRHGPQPRARGGGGDGGHPGAPRRRELRGVLAHELSHVRNRDTLIGTVAATLAGIISYAAQMLFWFGGSMLSRQR